MQNSECWKSFDLVLNFFHHIFVFNVILMVSLVEFCLNSVITNDHQYLINSV